MTKDEHATVAVPVRLLRKLVEDEPSAAAVSEAQALLPRRRLVAVEDDGTNVLGEYLATQPDLLTLLDWVLEDWRVSTFSGDIDTLSLRIRAALGVTE